MTAGTVTSMGSDVGTTLRTSSGRQICYAEFGEPSGAPVVLFHGFGDSRITRNPDDELTARLGVRLITMDRPGIGRSDPLRKLTLFDRIDDVVAVADALKLDRFAVLGWSGGAPFALAAAFLLGDRITRVGIASGFGPFERVGFRRLAPKEIRRVLFILKAAPWMSNVLASESAKQLTAGSGFDHERGMASAADSGLLSRSTIRDNIAAGAQEAFRQGHGGVAADMLLVFRFKWGFNPEDVRRPVDLWYGDEDLMTPVEVGQGLASVVPQARLHVVPRAGHLLYIQQWEAILRTLTSEREPEVVPAERVPAVVPAQAVAAKREAAPLGSFGSFETPVRVVAAALPEPAAAESAVVPAAAESEAVPAAAESEVLAAEIEAAVAEAEAVGEKAEAAAGEAEAAAAAYEVPTERERAAEEERAMPVAATAGASVSRRGQTLAERLRAAGFVVADVEPEEGTLDLGAPNGEPAPAAEETAAAAGGMASAVEEAAETDVTAPETEAAVPEPEAVVPETEAVVPEPEAVVPEPEAVVPEPEAVVPEPEAVVPELEAAPEPQAAETTEVSALAPEADAAAASADAATPGEAASERDAAAALEGEAVSEVEVPAEMEAGAEGAAAAEVEALPTESAAAGQASDVDLYAERLRAAGFAIGQTEPHEEPADLGVPSAEPAAAAVEPGTPEGRAAPVDLVAPEAEAAAPEMEAAAPETEAAAPETEAAATEPPVAAEGEPSLHEAAAEAVEASVTDAGGDATATEMEPVADETGATGEAAPEAEATTPETGAATQARDEGTYAGRLREAGFPLGQGPAEDAGPEAATTEAASESPAPAIESEASAEAVDGVAEVEVVAEDVGADERDDAADAEAVVAPAAPEATEAASQDSEPDVLEERLRAAGFATAEAEAAESESKHAEVTGSPEDAPDLQRIVAESAAGAAEEGTRAAQTPAAEEQGASPQAVAAEAREAPAAEPALTGQEGAGAAGEPEIDDELKKRAAAVLERMRAAGFAIGEEKGQHSR